MGVTPRNSFSRETRTQDKADGQLQKMRAFLVFALAASAAAQLKFSSDSTEAPKKDVNTRLGLLGTSLGLSPTAEQTSSGLTQGSGSGRELSVSLIMFRIRHLVSLTLDIHCGGKLIWDVATAMQPTKLISVLIGSVASANDSLSIEVVHAKYEDNSKEDNEEICLMVELE